MKIPDEHVDIIRLCPFFCSVMQNSTPNGNYAGYVFLCTTSSPDTLPQRSKGSLCTRFSLSGQTAYVMYMLCSFLSLP